MQPSEAKVAIVDYGLGNLFSIQRACQTVGLPAVVTADPKTIEASPAIILPGVGAFGDAMSAIRALGLAEVIQKAAADGKPLMGICLGMQLLADESFEFGRHKGLGIIPGSVVRLEGLEEGKGQTLKVPQVGWNQIFPASLDWRDSPLAALPAGEYLYFVHSYYFKPAAASVVLCRTRYGTLDFCSGLQRGNVCAFQFHPERSGPAGLGIYRGFAERLKTPVREGSRR